MRAFGKQSAKQIKKVNENLILKKYRWFEF
jgi:hypothetical protein